MPNDIVISITFSNGDKQGAYFPGQAIRGMLIVNLTAETKVSSILVGYLGTGEIWTLGELHPLVIRDKVTDGEETRRETYLDELREVYCHKDHDSGKIRPAGSHEFPFTFLLPDDLPTSFESAEGFIRYKITAYVEGPDYDLVTAENMFTINSVLDLNKDPRAKTPMFAHSTSESCLSLGCFSRQSLNAEIQIPSRGYAPGERIIVNAEVTNMKRQTVSMVKVALEQVIKYNFKSGPKKFKRVVSAVVRGPVAPYDVQVWKDESLLIPPVPASTASNSKCKIINIWYKLRFSMCMTGPERTLSLTLPVIIGTVPLKKNWNNFEHGLGDSPLSGVGIPLPNFEPCVFGPYSIGDTADQEYMYSPLFAYYHTVEEDIED